MRRPAYVTRFRGANVKIGTAGSASDARNRVGAVISKSPTLGVGKRTWNSSMRVSYPQDQDADEVMELVTRKIVLITEDLKPLGQLASRPVADYVASPTDEVLAERYLERIIAGQPPPRDYYESFTALATVGMLDRDFATRIAACAGLRNRIAREYETIDPVRVHEALQSAVRDVPAHLRRVAEFVGL